MIHFPHLATLTSHSIHISRNPLHFSVSGYAGLDLFSTQRLFSTDGQRYETSNTMVGVAASLVNYFFSFFLKKGIKFLFKTF